MLEHPCFWGCLHPLGCQCADQVAFSLFADKSTADEWKEQIKRNTLGDIITALCHYEKNYSKQNTGRNRQTIALLNDPKLNDKQAEGIKGTYELMLKTATKEAKRIKEEKAKTSEMKL